MRTRRIAIVEAESLRAAHSMSTQRKVKKEASVLAKCTLGEQPTAMVIEDVASGVQLLDLLERLAAEQKPNRSEKAAS